MTHNVGHLGDQVCERHGLTGPKVVVEESDQLRKHVMAAGGQVRT